MQFSRKLLASTFENIDAGISVVDADLKLVAWNSRYLDLFDYPAGMVHVGTPIADLIRHNARHGDFGPGDIDVHVRKRLVQPIGHGGDRRAGLGLAMVRRIVLLLGGRLDVHSRPGHGSVFSLSLPVHEAGDALPPPAIVRLDAASRRLRVLVVDDDARIVAATIALLQSIGHRGIGARSHEQALTLLDQADGALVDYQLGEARTGLDPIAELQRRRPGLPALLVTAESGADVAARAASMGIELLAKPATPQGIDAFLRTVSVEQIDAE